MSIYRWLPGFAASLFLTGLAVDVFSAELLVTRSFTGVWDQVDQESQGINLQIVEQADDSRVAVAYWYTYGSDRKSAWYLGIGHISDDQINFDLYNSEDVGFMEDGMPGDDSVRPIGTMTMSFESCDSGTVSYSTGYAEVGSGSFNIGRLTETMNMHCSGGISDDMDARAMFGEQRIPLMSAREGTNASGHARYESAPGRSQFEIETEGLPDGNYHLFVGLDDRGEFTVSGGFGELEFSSPMETGKRLLTFDPRGMQIGIHDGSGEVLSSFDNMFDHEQHVEDGDHDFSCDSGMGSGMGHGMGGGYNMGDCIDDGELAEIHVSLLNTGQVSGANGDAEWEMTSHYIEFSVEIEGVPAGSYALRVGGQEVGIITAKNMSGEVAGRILFRDPETFHALHLDFDPRGQTIEVIQQDNVILRADFPAE